MNPASVEALRQALGYYREGATSATKRLRSLRADVKDAEHQLAHAEAKIAELSADLAALEAGESESVRPAGVHYSDSIGDNK